MIGPLRNYVRSQLDRGPLSHLAFEVDSLLNAAIHTIAVERARILEPSEGLVNNALRRFDTFMTAAGKHRADACLGRSIVAVYTPRNAYVSALLANIESIIYARNAAKSRPEQQYKQARVVPISSARR